MGVKEPWGEGTPWKNSTAFFTYLRGCLRKAWSRNPIKLNVLKKRRYQISNPNPNGKKPTVWGAKCEMCDNEFPLSSIQVDHIEAAGKLNKTEDIQGFVERLLYVTEDDLRLVCVDCNSALAYADKYGISYEEACYVKIALSLQKKKLDKEWLASKGVVAAKTKDSRREQIVEMLKKEKENEQN